MCNLAPVNADTNKKDIIMPFIVFYAILAFCKAMRVKEDKTNKSDSYIIFTVVA